MDGKRAEISEGGPKSGHETPKSPGKTLSRKNALFGDKEPKAQKKPPKKNEEKLKKGQCSRRRKTQVSRTGTQVMPEDRKRCRPRQQKKKQQVLGDKKDSEMYQEEMELSGIRKSYRRNN